MKHLPGVVKHETFHTLKNGRSLFGVPHFHMNDSVVLLMSLFCLRVGAVVRGYIPEGHTYKRRLGGSILVKTSVLITTPNSLRSFVVVIYRNMELIV